MRVLELWRFPVKSLQGERLDVAELGAGGIAGDRQWALFDVATGFGLTARREPDLLFAAARVRPDGGVEIVLPDGTVTADDAVLSDWLGRPVALRSAAAVTERPPLRGAGRRPGRDAHAAGTTGWAAGGAFHDNAGRPGLAGLHRHRSAPGTGGGSAPTSSSTAPGRTRSPARGCGSGGAVLAVGTPIPRCVMVTRPQPGGIGRDTGVLKTIHRERGGELAIGGAGARRRDASAPATFSNRPDAHWPRAHRRSPLRRGHHPARSAAQARRRRPDRRPGEGLPALDGTVRVNGEPEERRGRQLHRGDVVAVEGMEDVRIG